MIECAAPLDRDAQTAEAEVRGDILLLKSDSIHLRENRPPLCHPAVEPRSKLFGVKLNSRKPKFRPQPLHIIIPRQWSGLPVGRRLYFSLIDSGLFIRAKHR